MIKVRRKNMLPSELLFKRRFSVNMYKTLRLKTGEMSMYKDWVNDKRGDPYTVLMRNGVISEKISDNSYRIEGTGLSAAERLIGGFFPYYSYEMRINELRDARVGFAVTGALGSIVITVGGDGVAKAVYGDKQASFDCQVKNGDVFSVTFRRGGVSLYVDRGSRPELIGDINDMVPQELSDRAVYEKTVAAVHFETENGGYAVISGVLAYLCGGLSQADIKPMKYEDGTPIVENGRVYLTVTSRLEAEMYQSVISWNPTLCDFRMEGALFFDSGDGQACGDVASSVVYDRNARRWYIWMCTFSHGHVLARATFTSDPRFGIQVLDVNRLPLCESADRTEFGGFEGDEDPDLCFIDGKWNLTVCRLMPTEDGKREYRYFRFTSDQPLDGFVFADVTPTGGKTGGMMTRIGGSYFFVCGTDFDQRANYDVYDLYDFSKRERLVADYDDGGFRGWGSVFEIEIGTRVKRFWITFDRHNASGYNWSYGNVYVYEA